MPIQLKSTEFNVVLDPDDFYYMDSEKKNLLCSAEEECSIWND